VRLDGVDIYKEIADVSTSEPCPEWYFKSNPFPNPSLIMLRTGGRSMALKTERDREAVEDTLRGRFSGMRSRTSWRTAPICYREAKAAAMYSQGPGGAPGVLLMDEPASALDPISTSKIEDLISRAKTQLHNSNSHP